MGATKQITLIGARPAMAGPRVLVAGSDPESRQWLRDAIAGEYTVDEVTQGTLALDLIAADAPRIVVIGPVLADMGGGELIEHLGRSTARNARMSLFLLADSNGEWAAVDESRVIVFYRLPLAMQRARVRELFRQAAATLPPVPPLVTDRVPAHVSTFLERIGAQAEPEGAAREAIMAVIALAGAQRARCLYCDEDTGALWPEGEDAEHDATASTGLVGFAVRTGASIAAPNVADDPLYCSAIDDPGGNGRERLAVQPVAGLDGHVHAVLIAVRNENQPPFSDEDLAPVQALARGWAPYLQHLALRAEVESIVGDRLDAGPSDLFRQEAIMSLMRRGARGDVVRVHPGWVHVAYWLVLAALLAMIGFAAFARVHEYTDGPAIVRFTGRTDVVAFESGTVTTLEVRTGEAVVEGQPLAQLYDAEQLAKLHGIEREFERNLIAYLQSPADPGVRQNLARIVSERESARAGVDAKVIRAPRAGTIKEIRVRTGQRVDSGTPVMSIIEAGAREGLSVLAFVPGSQRPRLRPYQELSFTLPGYRGVRITTRIMAVSSDVLGTSDARTRYLGERAADSLAIHGAVVVVEAPLESATFEAGGKRYELHDGMIGTAEVRLSSRSLLGTLIPGFER